MIYLASPYSDKKAAIVTMRYKITVRCVAKLMEKGHPVFSPIVHNHIPATKHNLPTDAAFWWNYNKNFLRFSTAVFVLQIPGWEKSKGIAQELQTATVLDIPVYYINANGEIVPAPAQVTETNEDN